MFDPQLKKILTFSVGQISIKLFYLYQKLQCRDNYFFKVKFVFFLYLLLSASSKENVKTRKRRNVVGIDMSDSKQPYCNMFFVVFFSGRLVYLSRLLIDILHCQLNPLPLICLLQSYPDINIDQAVRSYIICFSHPGKVRTLYL